MKKTWTDGQDAHKAQRIEDAFKASSVLRQRLKEICQKEMDGSYDLSKSQYDCPNWQMLQADSVGYRRALDKILRLIS